MNALLVLEGDFLSLAGTPGESTLSFTEDSAGLLIGLPSRGIVLILAEEAPACL